MRPKTPPEYVEAYINASVTKAYMPTGKLFLMGIMAGAFVAIGAASASAASHALTYVGVAKAMELYGITAEQINSINMGNFFIGNLLPVTLGNMVEGMLFISLPLYILHKEKIFVNPTHRTYLRVEEENKEIIEKELHHHVGEE